jgi:hypothetical protein
MGSGLMRRTLFSNCSLALRGLKVRGVPLPLLSLDAHESVLVLGPARLYTLRGRYRQFFLRVSADGVEDCISANLRVTPTRTLDVVVEVVSSFSFWWQDHIE